MESTASKLSERARRKIGALVNAPLWTAHLNSQSPRYGEWRQIFDSDAIKISSPLPVKAKLGEEETRIYAIRVADLSAEELKRLVIFMAAKFSVSEEAIALQISADQHFPIREQDVIVAFSTRAFI